jgi:hypothetical protein
LANRLRASCLLFSQPSRRLTFISSSVGGRSSNACVKSLSCMLSSSRNWRMVYHQDC